MSTQPEIQGPGYPLRPLRQGERERLLRIASLCEIEARSWAEGFAVDRDGVLRWNKEDDFAQIRYMRHVAAADFLRHLANRPPESNGEI
jgi:hypothetical protein